MSHDTSRRMKQYLFLRLLIVVVGFILVTFYVTYLQPERKEATTAYLFSILALYGCVGVTSLLTFGHWVENRELRRLQVVVDFGLQALLVWSTGGLVSFFIPLLFVTFVSATSLGSMRGAFILASLATAFLVGNTILYAVDVTPPWGVHEGQTDSMRTAYLVMSVLGLFGLSVLGSRYSCGLREVEGLQVEVIENMGEGLVVVDRNAHIVLMNEELRRILDLEESSAAYHDRSLVEVLRTCRSLQHDKGISRSVLDALLDARRGRFEIAPVDFHGRPRPVAVKVSAIHDDLGVACYRIALFSDLTLQKELEEQNRRIQKLEDLRELAMGLAHEIRNPLASIRGCVQELGRLSPGSSGQDRLVEIVLRESDRLDGIIEDFQRFACPAPRSFGMVELASVIEEAVLLLENRCDLGDREIAWERPEFDVEVAADRSQLVQVLLNLGINAIQATEEVDGRIRFELRRISPEVREGEDVEEAPRAVETVEIHVWDNGRGIPSADQERVFNPFFTTKKAGSGMGLSIVEKTIREHQGVIDVASHEGVGTRFVVRLNALPSSTSRLHRDEAGAVPAVCHA